MDRKVRTLWARCFLIGVPIGLLWNWAAWGQVGSVSPTSPASSSYLKAAQGSPTSPGDSWWTHDKRLHLVTSVAAVGWSYHLIHDRWGLEKRPSRHLAISLVALAGIAKEFRDRRKTPPTCSLKDLLADGLGIAAGIILFTK